MSKIILKAINKKQNIYIKITMPEAKPEHSKKLTKPEHLKR